MVPKFDDVDYWNARFRSEQEFEWLKSPGEILPLVRAILLQTPDEDQNILHIGPGSSALSLALRGSVSRPEKIHNVDYSQSAVSLGKAWEQEFFPDNPHEAMRWTCSNLLDPRAVTVLMNDDLFDPQYSLIVDKSTSDSIACGPDATLNPRRFRTTTDSHDADEQEVHPVVLLALHLAVLSAPGACWLSLSYSAERFSFLTDREESCDSRGSLKPSDYWILESVESVPVDNVENGGQSDTSPIHRPRLTYWMYHLKRTDRKLALFTTT